VFEKYFVGKNLTLDTSPFNGRSDYGPFLDAGVPCGGLDTGADVIKTEEQARIYGGIAGKPMDINYHGPGDTLANISRPFLEINSKAIAFAAATYSTSWADLPARVAPPPPPIAPQLWSSFKQEAPFKGHNTRYKA
jgi:carboxypeptidase Q